MPFVSKSQKMSLALNQTLSLKHAQKINGGGELGHVLDIGVCGHNFEIVVEVNHAYSHSHRLRH